jgi:hypothetical protein
MLVFYPLPYYVTDTASRYIYEYPIQPEMLALAAFAVVREKSSPSHLKLALRLGRECRPSLMSSLSQPSEIINNARELLV